MEGGKELYPWQEECLKRWLDNHARGIVQAVTGSGKTRLALEAAARLEEALGERLLVKIVVPTGSLLRQWNRELRAFLEESKESEEDHFQWKTNGQEEIGLRGGGYRTPDKMMIPDKSGRTAKNSKIEITRTSGNSGKSNNSNMSTSRKYMIYVINSARYELARQILSELQSGEPVLLIADECHRYSSGQNQLIFEFLPFISSCSGQFFSLGLSATLPGGADGRYLASVLGPKIYQYGMAEAALERTICSYDIYHIGLFFQEEERVQYNDLTGRLLALDTKLKKLYPELKEAHGADRFELLQMLTGNRNPQIAEAAVQYMRASYKRKSLLCQASSRIFCAVELIARLEPTEKILVFGERIGQAEELYQMLQEDYPGRVGRYHSKMGEQANKNTLERFRTGELRILIACKGMDEGVDIPDATVGIILSGTSVQRQRVQRLGRLIRNREGKKRASLYYLHITESSEDNCFLPEGGRKGGKDNRIFELEYFSASNQFVHPSYDKAASKLLRYIYYSDISEEKIEEIKRCLYLGCIRSDWMLEQEELEKNIRKAKTVGEKNYWICMKRVGRENQ